jgi:casein kinase I family protein HRR25
MPGLFEQYFTYIHNLNFETQPNYQYLKGLIRKMMQEKDFKMDAKFDWMDGEYNHGQRL